mgnify:CR=1 FL=1
MKALSEFPQYQAERDKLDSLTAEMGRLDRERAELQGAIRDALKHGQDIDRRAQALLDGDVQELAAVRDLEDRLRSLDEKISVLRRAAQMQSERVQKERRAASRAVCDELRPSFHLLCTRYASAREALYHAEMALADFKQEMARADIEDLLGQNPIVQPVRNGWQQMQAHMKHALAAVGVPEGVQS